MRRMPSLWCLAVLATAFAAEAQDEPTPEPPVEPRPERLYLNSGVLMGSTRMVAMGGAFAGIAEGTAGFASNLAALAHRAPGLERDWDVGVTFSLLDVPISNRRRQDLDNDGLADEAPRSRQYLLGLLLQYKKFGLGTFLRTRTVSYCATPECRSEDYIRVSVTHSALAGALAFGQDDFIVSLGLYAGQATLSQGKQDWRYGGTGLSLDMLFRPHGRPYRIGIAVRPEVVGNWQQAEGQQPVLGGRPIYSGVVSPAVLSLGASRRFGEGAERYNRLAPSARRQLLEDGELNMPPDEPLDVPSGSLLVSGQVDFISSVERSVALRSVASFDTQPESVGSALLIQPRVGAEHDTWPGRVRTRLGLFVEPSPFEDQAPRPHLTGGFEVFLFRYWQDWSFSGSFDLARRYTNVGLSIGFWR
ncbi:hypothetical protein [Stigmatella aurantiaca]|uniref:Conserved uncharacterized protein n=1 Tax=Stigmatella aurantiaca (strain DW4/3-1) TaxID=378806 RepID=E3FEV3_STIAD|nr:hypothetical protein [Stigmatella aurantiaca]ADO68934.1 conserved uncharacterized protein [Stigmatella aurantiaca DW4/3-1]